jgi:hypothetical protein
MAVDKAETMSMNSFVTLSLSACSCSRVSPSGNEAILAYLAVADVAVRRLEVLRQLDVELALLLVEEVLVHGIISHRSRGRRANDKSGAVTGENRYCQSCALIVGKK